MSNYYMIFYLEKISRAKMNNAFLFQCNQKILHIMDIKIVIKITNLTKHIVKFIKNAKKFLLTTELFE